MGEKAHGHVELLAVKEVVKVGVVPGTHMEEKEQEEEGAGRREGNRGNGIGSYLDRVEHSPGAEGLATKWRTLLG